MTQIFDAIESRNFEEFTRLISDPDLDLNICRNKYGETPLIIVSDGKLIMLQLLLETRPEIDINQADNNGNTALIKAVFAGFSLAVSFLLKKRKDININQRDKNGGELRSQVVVHDNFPQL